MHWLSKLCCIVVFSVASVVSVEASSQITRNTVVPDPDCGAKCLYVILRSEGLGPSKYRELVDQLGVAPAEGYSMLDLRNNARENGMFAECVKMGRRELFDLPTGIFPILHMKPSHFVLCKEFTNNSVTIVDASRGSTLCDTEEALANWTGNALLVSGTEIDLSNKRSAISRVLIICAMMVALAIGLAIYRQRRVFGLCLIVLLPSVFSGCEQGVSDGAEGAPMVSGVATSSGLWVDDDFVDAGVLQRSSKPQKLNLQLKNFASTPITISDINVSCRCLSVRLAEREIPPRSEQPLVLLLDRSSLGPKHANCSIFEGSGNVLKLDVNWQVATDLRFRPDVLEPIELSPGSQKQVEIELLTKEGLEAGQLQVDGVWETGRNRKPSDVVLETQIFGSKCVALFRMPDDASVGGTGSLRFSNAENEIGVVPFRVIAALPFSVSPEKLFLPKNDGNFTVQIIVEAAPEVLETISLSWVYDGVRHNECVFEVSIDGETAVIEVSHDLRSIQHGSHLCVRAGSSFQQVIPVVFPDN